MEVYEEMLAPVFGDREPDITEENLQARIRGNLLMALSNKFGWLVLTTGNKSENSVGYSTLYGDSAGGFAVIKDVPKTLVYRLVDFRNARDDAHPVPRSIVDRPPSAELRPDQKDADSLPDYDTLDAILEAYIEEDAAATSSRSPGCPERGRRARVRAGRPGRVQAPPGPAGDQDHAARVRPRPADADHERLSRRLSPLRNASSISACRKWPRLMRATPELGQPLDRGRAGAQQDVHRRADLDEPAIVASSVMPIGYRQSAPASR